MTPEGSAAAVVMLGIDGVRVLEAREIDGEIELVVETTTDRAWCGSCGVRAHSKGRPTVVVRDVTGFGRRSRLRWRKRRWRCPEPACRAGSWTEQHPALPSLTTARCIRRHLVHRGTTDGAQAGPHRGQVQPPCHVRFMGHVVTTSTLARRRR